MKFEQFSVRAHLAAVNTGRLHQPTPIQARGSRLVLEGRDVIGLAQTGTGKTASFVLPILERLTEGPSGKRAPSSWRPRGELAEQIYQSSVDLGANTKIRSVAIYGGVGKGPQIAALRRGTEIIIACPGRLLDLLDEGYVDLSHVEMLVLDEADRMCDMGFLPDIRRIIAKLPGQRQTRVSHGRPISRKLAAAS